jgi:hypothetical protein
MNKRTRIDATDCHRGMDCYKINCPFSHPHGWVRKLIPCRDALKCAKSDCSCVHPENWDWRSNINCKNKNECANHDCTYKHSEGWSWRANVPCKFANECKANISGTCKFKHTPISDDINLNLITEKMNNVAITIDCKYGKGCFTKGCFYNHPEGWDHRKNTICNFGLNCKNKDTTCMFKHVKKEKKKEKPKENEMNVEEKKIEKKIEKKKENENSSSQSSNGGGGGELMVDVMIGEKIKLAIHRKKHESRITMDV